MSSIPLSIEIDKSYLEGLSMADFNRKEVMACLVKSTRNVANKSRSLLSKKGTSKVGDFPAKDTGLMRRKVHVVKAKRKDRYWARVEVASMPEVPMWYPAPLMYGSATLKPRRDAIWYASDMNKLEVQERLLSVMAVNIKGWK